MNADEFIKILAENKFTKSIPSFDESINKFLKNYYRNRFVIKLMVPVENSSNMTSPGGNVFNEVQSTLRDYLIQPDAHINVSPSDWATYVMGQEWYLAIYRPLNRQETISAILFTRLPEWSTKQISQIADELFFNRPSSHFVINDLTFEL